MSAVPDVPHVPEYAPVAPLTEIEAWKARKTYPSVLFAGGPVFGVARERAEGGWELQPHFAGLTPQDARDDLGCHFRTLAQAAGRDGDASVQAEYLAAADRLDREPLDEMTVRGERYRVVRAERFIRMGPDGPEPPRATDPDPGGPGAPGSRTDPADGLVIAPFQDSPSGGVLSAELLAAVGRHGTVRSAVADDSRAAVHTHPGGVLLPATFMTAERRGRSWRPDSAGIATTPQAARDDLATHLRVIVPWRHELSAEESEVYKRAADRLDTERCDELDVAGRHYRIVRVERLLRLGPGGPEGPRSSDTTPYDRPDHDDELCHDAEAPLKRIIELFEEERVRRASLGRGTG
ncbi:DUF5954 family protein [Streptomyces sp.]|uniref:DUF5954 family protein n=1 Tax=Streptomyces sp. TaxID=1931 RepID=UPI002F41D41C